MSAAVKAKWMLSADRRCRPGPHRSRSTECRPSACRSAAHPGKAWRQTRPPHRRANVAGTTKLTGNQGKHGQKGKKRSRHQAGYPATANLRAALAGRMQQLRADENRAPRRAASSRASGRALRPRPVSTTKVSTKAVRMSARSCRFSGAVWSGVNQQDAEENQDNSGPSAQRKHVHRGRGTGKERHPAA